MGKEWAEVTIYKPELAKIKKVEKLTRTETLLEIELLSGRSLGHQPGQFVEVSVFGVGEAPISVSSAPSDSPAFQLCVRAVGNVTNALCGRKPGDVVGIRGPFGRGFELQHFRGRDVLFVAGGLGLAPLRSLIWAILNSREDYGKVYILYGARRPQELLFREELKIWEEREDVEYHVTVDVGEEGWRGNVGVITTLFPHVKFDPVRTQVAVVGPPVMYRFVIRELKNRRVPDENIWVSLERKMKCGVGKCGHCQINNVYVCQDGPVFNYTEIRDLPEAI
jgi:sulfite reductase subunit B